MSVSRYLVKYVIRWRHRHPLKPQIGLQYFHFSNRDDHWWDIMIVLVMKIAYIDFPSFLLPLK